MTDTPPSRNYAQENTDWPAVEKLSEQSERIIASIPIYIGLTGDALRLVCRQVVAAEKSASSETQRIKGHQATRWEVSANGHLVTIAFDTLPNMEAFLTEIRQRG